MAEINSSRDDHGVLRAKDAVQAFVRITGSGRSLQFIEKINGAPKPRYA
jgi:hypothetical protein